MRIYDDNNMHRYVGVGSRRVRPVSRVSRTGKFRRKRSDQKKQEHHLHDHTPEAEDHFDELELEVEELQQWLIDENRPFTIDLTHNKERVLLTISRITEEGTTLQLVERDITHGSFTAWAKMLMEGEGMLFNEEG